MPDGIVLQGAVAQPLALDAPALATGFVPVTITTTPEAVSHDVGVARASP